MFTKIAHKLLHILFYVEPKLFYYTFNSYCFIENFEGAIFFETGCMYIPQTASLAQRVAAQVDVLHAEEVHPAFSHSPICLSICLVHVLFFWPLPCDQSSMGDPSWYTSHGHRGTQAAIPRRGLDRMKSLAINLL